MANKYDQLLDAQQGGSPVVGRSVYDDMLDEEQALQQKRVRTLFEKALETNPDKAAEAAKLSKASGMPPDMVERNLDEVKRKEQARMLDLARMAQDSPILARQLLDPTFTKQAHDDVDNLSMLEQGLKFSKDLGGAVKAGVYNASRGAAGTFRAGFELVAPVLDSLEGVTAIGGNPLRRIAEGFDIQAQNAGAIAQQSAPKTEGNLAGGFFSGVQSLTQNALALPLAFSPGGQGAALTMMTSSTGGNAYQDARDKGLTMQQALPYAVSQAAVEYATEKLPLGTLVRDVNVGTPLFQTVVNQLKSEIPGEQIATVLQDLNDWAVLNPDKSFSQYMAERPDAAAQTLVATIVGTGGNVAVAKGVESVMRRAGMSDAQAQEADQAALQLKQQIDIAAAAKLRERNPEEFRNLVQTMADNTEGALKEVYVDAGVLNQLAPEVQAQLPQSVRDQLAQSLTQDSLITVPVADVLTIAPGTPLEQFFVENARLNGPDSLSQAEAKEAGAKAQEFLAAESQRVIQQAADQQAMQESSDRVKQSVLDQLNSVGRFRKDVNEGYATWTAAFYTTMAGRYGLTPEEMATQYPLRITGQSGQGAALMNQEGGKTVIYHGTSAKAAKAIEAKGFDVSKSADGSIWFTSNPDIGEVAASQSGAIIKRAFDESKLKLGGWDESDKYTTDELIARGYDGLKLEDDGETTYQIFKPEKLEKVAQQLNQSATDPLRNPTPEQVASEKDGAARALLALGGKDLAFKRPRSAATEIEQIAVDKGIPTIRKVEDTAQANAEFMGGISVQEDGVDSLSEIMALQDVRNGMQVWFAKMDDTVVDGQTVPGASGYIVQDGTKLYINVSGSKEGTGGSGIYDLAANYAANNGLVFIGDPNGVSSAAMSRRLENMLSAAVKYGSTDFLAPHPDQTSGRDGVPGFKWTDGDTVGNIQAMLEASAENTERLAPFATTLLGYDPNENALIDATTGSRLSADEVPIFTSADVRAKGVGGPGNTTVQRAVKIRALLSSADARRSFLETVRSLPDGPGNGNTLSGTFYQGPRGTFNPKTLELALNENADLSTFLHETGHFFLEVMADLASQPNAPADIQQDMAKILQWFGVADLQTWQSMTLEQQRPYHERFAESMEQYLLEGKAPSLELQPLFRKFRAWLLNVYKSLKSFIDSRVPVTSGGDGLAQAPMTDAFKRWFGDSKVVGAAGKPLVVYHGGEKGISAFDKAKIGANFGYDKDGFFFTTERGNYPGTADNYAGPDGEVYPVYLSLQKPYTLEQFASDLGLDVQDLVMQEGSPQSPITIFDTDREEVMRRVSEGGYDGVAFQVDYGDGTNEGMFVALNPEQIKSATGNNGEYDPNNPSIFAQDPNAAPGANIQLSDEIRQVFDRMLASQEQIAQAEEVAGLLPDADATTEAVEKLTARSLRDLKWTVNARAKAIKALQKQAKELRREARIDARREVMSEPIYQAWSFLTAKIPEYDKLGKPISRKSSMVDPAVDDLLTAVAKLGGIARQSAQRDLGVHPDEFNRQSGVFGSPIFRKNGGKSADAMGEALVEHGYLKADEYGKHDMHDLEDKIANALAGDPEYSMFHDYRYEEPRAGETHSRNPESAGRLDEGELRLMGVDPAVIDSLRERGMTAKNGMHPDIVADIFGIPSGEYLATELAGATPPAKAIEGKTDQLMLERHGDLVDQRAIEEAANEAVHNEARARVLATELKAQADMLGARTDTGEVNAAGNRVTVNTLVAAAKQFAENVVAQTPLRDLKAAAWRHTAAERRAGKRWQEATAAGKTQDAVQAKRDQMLNNAAAKAAIDAQAEMRKMLEFFKRVIKDNNEKVVDKGRDPDVVNAARAVLSAYGLAPNAGKTALEYMELVQKNDPALYATLQPSVQGALNMAQPLDSLTIEELRGLHEEIQAMWHLAKRSRQMEIDGNMLDLQDAEDELQARMQTIGVPDTVPGETGAITPSQAAARQLQHALSLLTRAEQWAQGMGAEFTRLVFQPVKSAADRYRADRIKYRKKYQELVDAVAPFMDRKLIEAPEIGYTFGQGHNGIGHAELLHAILHTGNESNKRKLLVGRGWATVNEDGTLDTTRWDMFINRMHNTGVLTKAHYDFAQGVWDLLEETKPLAQKTHRDVFGRYFAEVTADAFDTPFGQYRGGYVPAQADPQMVQDADMRELAEAENQNMAFSFPTTSKGFTKSRVEYNRPLKLDLRTIGQHIDKVLLFSHMEPAVRDVNKLLSRKGVSYSLGRIDPTIYAGMLTPWLKRAATQTVETPVVGDGGISRVLSAARNRAGMALMFANVSNTLQQITGFSTALTKVKAGSMMRATAQFIAEPKKTAKAVAEASTFMAGRMDNEIAAINDAINDILLDPNLYEKSQAWAQKHAYFLQTAMANTMEPIIWTAAYNEALQEGQSETDAVRYADSVIRTTQGSTLPEDVSRIETGPAYARIFTQFVGYFNMMANTNGYALKQLSREMGLKKGAGKALGVVFFGMLAPLWVAEAIAQGMRGGPEDEDDDGYLDDWLAAVFGMGTIKGTLAQVPFIGQLANAGINRFNGNPADDKMSLSPAVSLLESAVGVPVDVYKAMTDPEKLNTRTAVRDVASAVSLATGLPAVAVARPLVYLAGIEDGKIDPTGPVDMTRGVITGTPSPQSK